MQLVQEYDLVDIIGEGVFGDEWKQSQVLLEVSDIVFSGENQLAALVGYSESQAASSSASNSGKQFGVALLDLSGRSNSVTVSRFIDMTYVPVCFIPRHLLSSESATNRCSLRLRTQSYSCQLAGPWHMSGSRPPWLCCLSHRVSCLPGHITLSTRLS